ncbi:hypothetical protein [Streptomyces sp. NPDC048419]|uniref:hypothetical protein n=1 Tax=Streptomyces sp. NPDC048419 TaxID=3365547 RepID=UPI0037162600
MAAFPAQGLREGERGGEAPGQTGGLGKAAVSSGRKATTAVDDLLVPAGRVLVVSDAAVGFAP